MLEQEKHIFDAMEVIDPILVERKVPLRNRPLSAALMFVKLFVVSVSCGDKENPISEPWFSIIYHHVREWYEDTYGKAWTNQANRVLGAVCIREIPTEFLIPNTRSKAEIEGETSWLIFPSTIDDEEVSEQWLVNSPNLTRLTQAETDALADDMKIVASCLRQISIFVNTCEIPNSVFSKLSGGILNELEAAARGPVSNTSSSIQSSIWSMQMALERTLKSLSIQQRGEFRETHDLFVLYDDLADVSTFLDRGALNRFPRWRANVSRRYGLEEDADLFQAFQRYKLSMQFIRDATELFNRRVKIGDARILIQRPRFLDLERALGSPDDD
jgi:hypothetical protein